MKKECLVIGLMMLSAMPMYPASVAPSKLLDLHERMSTATSELRKLLFDAKTGIITYSQRVKPSQAALAAHENLFDEHKAELESALYELLDTINTLEPSKNFSDTWSFDVPDYPIIEEQPAMQQEYQRLMNGFHAVINKENFVAHFFDMWLTNNYENEVIGIFYTIGQDLIARSIDDLAAAYYNYVDALKDRYGIK